MYSFSQFYQDYPLQTMKLDGYDFTYRYHKNPNAKETLVLLTGGIGFSDLFFQHFHRFARDFSVLTFDYHIQYPTIGSFCDGAAGLLKALGIKGWLVGQSLGGVVAQVLASRHPEVVEGLVLSNTASLSGSMPQDARQFLLDMVNTQKKMKVLVRILPFGLYKQLCKLAVMRFKTEDFDPEERLAIRDILDAMLRLMNRPYEYHMIDLLLDTVNYEGLTTADFAFCQGKILLILSPDDKTFSDSVKQSLTQLMPDPRVVTDLTGGHLALLLRMESYARTVTEFIRSV